MAETITITGGRKHNWNRKIRGQKLVRLTVPTTELNLAGVLQWVEGMIYAKKYSYDRIKAKIKVEDPHIEDMYKPIKSIKELAERIAEMEMK